MHKKQTFSLGRAAIARFIAWGFLGIVILFTVYPVLYALFGSLKTNFELTLGGNVLPEKWMFSNYPEAFLKGNFARYTINSLVLSGMTMLLSLTTASMAGYVFARHEFPGKKFIQGMYLAFLFVAMGSVTLLPLYRLMKTIGLSGNLSGMALVMTGGQATSVFLIMGFFKSIPKELDEAAVLDGCGFFRIFSTILLPLIRPILGVVGLFSFRLAWNEYLIPLVMSIGNPNLRTLTVGVVQLRYSANAAAEWQLMLAGASIALVPILIIYIFTNRQFISGLTAGSVKG
jgi:raffinose/stachyose/melibiose transport system permease protein